MITKVFLLTVPYAQKLIRILTFWICQLMKALKNNLPTSFSRLNCHVTNARVELEAQRRRGYGWMLDFVVYFYVKHSLARGPF